MTNLLRLPPARPAAAVVALALSVVLSGCGGGSDTGGTAGAGSSAPDQTSSGHHASPLPSAHVHGVAIDPVGGTVHLATHEGLFRYGAGGPERLGPVVDLMGFTAVGEGRFYASGHPGPGVDLPEPLGLVESTDGGRTWLPVSRQGESDFHALAASEAAVVGFDGTALRRTTDGTTWTVLEAPVEPFALAMSADGQVVLATSRSGPARSVDGGATWSVLGDAPLLAHVAWAGDGTVVGVTPDGRVAVSEDAGATWSERGRLGGQPQAVAAHLGPEGLRVVAVTGEAVLESTDGGASFSAL